MDIKLSTDRNFIKNYVGLSSFQKGESYASHQAIKLGKIKNCVITAVCQGHEFDPYTVQVIFNDQGIEQSYCSCPVGAGGKCKHIAALLLTWHDHPEEFAEWQEIRKHLKDYDSNALLELIDLLEERVEGSADVIHSFQRNLQQLKSPNLAKYLKRIEEAFHVSRLPWYHPDEAAASEIAFALSKVRSDANQMIEAHNFNEAILIYHTLIQHILIYLDEHRDPWGTLGEEMKECAQGLEMALKLLPKGQELRQKALQLLFRIIEEQLYRENNLGAEEAKRVILEHVTPEEREKVLSWVRAIQISKNDEAAESFWLKDFLIDLEKEKLDPEVYLTHYRQTGQIVKLVDSLLNLGRIREAETAAKQPEFVAQAFPLADVFVKYKQDAIAEHLVLEASRQRPTVDGFAWLKDFYRRHNQPDKALAQALHMLHLSPQFSYYQEVEDLAQSVGREKQVREEVISFLKDMNHQVLLVEIYLDEKDLKRAIEVFSVMTSQAVAQDGFQDANQFLLALRLASAARYKHPQDSIKIYQLVVQDLIEERNRDSYRRACDYLKIIRDIYKETHQIKAWQAYMKNFMQTYSRFRVLQDEMHRAGLL